jgi:hypothetical protein
VVCMTRHREAGRLGAPRGRAWAYRSSVADTAMDAASHLAMLGGTMQHDVAHLLGRRAALGICLVRL